MKEIILKEVKVGDFITFHSQLNDYLLVRKIKQKGTDLYLDGKYYGPNANITNNSQHARAFVEEPPDTVAILLSKDEMDLVLMGA